MTRAVDDLDPASLHVVCGCGGGAAVRRVLPRLLSTARSLVLDADALNAVAQDSGLQQGATGAHAASTRTLEASRRCV